MKMINIFQQAFKKNKKMVFDQSSLIKELENFSIRSQLEVIQPEEIKNSEFNKIIHNENIRGGWNYELDHTWIFKNVYAFYQKKGLPNDLVIYDIGCGDSEFHTFLESWLRMGIVGIDRVDGLCPRSHRNPIIDFNVEFGKSDFFNKETADIIYWCSSIEHNEIYRQKEFVEYSLNQLKPGGLLLITFALSPETNYYFASEQWNLSYSDALQVYGVEWEKTPTYNQVTEQYKRNILDLNSKHYNRYKTNDYSFIVAGCRIVKK